MDSLLVLMKLIVVVLALAQLYEITIARPERNEANRRKLASLKDLFEKLDNLEYEANTNVIYEKGASELREEDEAKVSEMVYDIKNAIAYLAEAADYDRGRLGLKTNADHFHETLN